MGFLLINLVHRVNIKWQRPLSGVHSIMIEKLTQAGEVGVARPSPLNLLPSRTKLLCLLQVRGQIYSTYFVSTPMYSVILSSQYHKVHRGRYEIGGVYLYSQMEPLISYCPFPTSIYNSVCMIVYLFPSPHFHSL
jgi:hypothetical protein